MKKIAVLLLVALFLMPIALIKTAIAEENEYLTWEYIKGGINIKCYVPMQAYAGDTLTIKIRIEVFETITNFDLWMSIFSTMGYDELSEDYILWSSAYLTLYYPELSSGVIRNEQFEVETPSNLQPGMVWGWFDIWWNNDGDWYYLPPYGTVAFTVTYLKNRACEDLETAYDELLVKYFDLLDDYNILDSTYQSFLAEYDELLGKYTSLLADYDDLNSTYNDLLTNYENLQNTHNALVSNYTDLNVDYGALQTNYSALQDSYDSLQANYATLEGSYDSLETIYNSLNLTFDSLKDDYNNMKTKYDTSVGDLGTTRNLSYILLVTTIIFIATSVVLFARKRVKPK